MDNGKTYRNALTISPFHDEIMSKYNDAIKSTSFKMSDFFRDHITPVLPNYKYESFRQYIKKIENDIALGRTSILFEKQPSLEVKKVVRTLLKADEATRRGIELMLNIGQDALAEIVENPEKLSVKDRAALLAAAMRAQDSRINAMARVRQDKREQITFEHVLGEAAYAEENE